MDIKKRKIETTGKGVEGLARENLKKLIEPFHADKYRKIFVRGLGPDTTVETLQDIFSSFGEVEKAEIPVGKRTGKSRGFAFVTFMHMDGAQQALKEPSKRIDGLMAFCRLEAAPFPIQECATRKMRKIYVRNVPPEMTGDRLLAIFAMFGEIEEGPIVFGNSNGHSQGFALIIYKSKDSARRCLQEPYKTMDGHKLHCKLARDSQKEKSGRGIGQSGNAEGSDAMKNGSQPFGDKSGRGLLGDGGNFHHGSKHHGIINTGIPLSHGQRLLYQYPDLTQILIPSMANSASQGLNSGFPQDAGQQKQVPTPLALATDGNRVGIFDCQPTSYSSTDGMSLYGLANNSLGQLQATALQNAAVAYRNNQLAVAATPGRPIVGSLPPLPVFYKL